MQVSLVQMHHVQHQVGFLFEHVNLSIQLGDSYHVKSGHFMAAIEIPMAKLFGQPGAEISNFCGSPLMMSLKSSKELSMVAIEIWSVTDLVMAMNSSSC
jgi:hypothetical protein